MRTKMVMVAGLVTLAAGSMARSWEEKDGLRGKVSVPPANRLQGDSVLTIALDANGIGSWRFLNPRRPANLFRDLEKRIEASNCTDAAKAERKQLIRQRDAGSAGSPTCGVTEEDLPLQIAFQNRTPDDTFTVKFSVPVRGAVAEVEGLVLAARARGEGTFVRRLLLDEGDDSGLDALAAQAGYWRQAFAAHRWLSEARHLPAAQAPAPALLEERRALFLRAATRLKLPRCVDPKTDEAWQACHASLEEASPWELLNFFDLLERQRKVDQRLGIVRHGAAPQEPPANTGPLCNLKAEPRLVCDFNLTVPPGETLFLDATRLSELAGSTLGAPLPAITFEVSAFGRPRLVRANGYMTVTALVEEPEGRATPRLQGAQQVGWTPSVLAIAPELPFDSPVKRTFPSLSSLSLVQSLGNRANLSATLALREDEFGGNNAPTGVNSAEIYLTVHSMLGSEFTFGRMPVTAPGQKIAVNLAGDAASLRIRSGVLSVVRGTKERLVVDSAQPAAAAGLPFEDERVTGVLELQSLSVPGAGNVSVSLLALAGHSDARRKDRSAMGVDALDRRQCDSAGTECDYSFQTFGGDLAFNATKTVSGSLALYHSRRSGPEALSGRGTAVLGTLSMRRNNQKGAAVRGLSLLAGYGTGERPGGRNTAYLGETASFAPDLLFVRQLAPMMGGGRGLANKIYLQVGANDQTSSPLAFLARTLLHVPDADIATRASFVRLHQYRFVEPVFGARNAGFEIDAVSQLESPRDVKWQLSAGRYFPPDAYTTLFRRAPWTVAGSITINVQ